MTKVAIVGVGAIGGNVASALAKQNGYQLQLIDKNEGVAIGKGLDLVHGASVHMQRKMIRGSGKLQDLEGADVVVVTAGIPRKGNMDRVDLITTNAAVIQEIAEGVRMYAPSAFVIIVTNPLDSMTWLFQKKSQLPAERVVGMAGMLDIARFRHCLAQELDMHPSDIQTQVIGSHDDLMVPLIRYTSIGGIPLKYFIQTGRLNEGVVAEAIKRTKKSGAQIVRFLKTQSAYYAPAECIVRMIENYVYDTKAITTCATHIGNTELKRDVYIGMPVILSSAGVEEILELELTPFEQKSLMQSILHVEAVNKTLIIDGDNPAHRHEESL